MNDVPRGHLAWVGAALATLALPWTVRADRAAPSRTHLRFDSSDVVREAGADSIDAMLEQMLNARRPALEACFARVLAAEPALGGDVVLVDTIGTDGRSTATVRVSSVQSAAVGSCAARVLSGAHFEPPPLAPVTFAITLHFSTPTAERRNPRR